MDGFNELNERVISLETRLAFQDRALEELNKIVTEQQDEIDRLTKDLRQVMGQMHSLLVTKAEEPPPHY